MATTAKTAAAYWPQARIFKYPRDQSELLPVGAYAPPPGKLLSARFLAFPLLPLLLLFLQDTEKSFTPCVCKSRLPRDQSDGLPVGKHRLPPPGAVLSARLLLFSLFSLFLLSSALF